jgi:hypothetical protein
VQLSQAQKCQAATHCMSAAHASAAVAQLVASYCKRARVPAYSISLVSCGELDASVSPTAYPNNYSDHRQQPRQLAALTNLTSVHLSGCGAYCELVETLRQLPRLQLSHGRIQMSFGGTEPRDAPDNSVRLREECPASPGGNLTRWRVTPGGAMHTPPGRARTGSPRRQRTPPACKGTEAPRAPRGDARAQDPRGDLRGPLRGEPAAAQGWHSAARRWGVRIVQRRCRGAAPADAPPPRARVAAIPARRACCAAPRTGHRTGRLI